jgi:hypothetical protein
MRRLAQGIVFGAFLFLASSAAEAQFFEVNVDPALGRKPIFGPGGYPAPTGNGYGINRNGRQGYMPGLYFPGDGLGNGPSPYYSPIYPSLSVAAPADRHDPANELPRRSVLGRLFHRNW